MYFFDPLDVVFLGFKPVLRHKGCDCDKGYEGDYCEYIHGQGPVMKTKKGAFISWFVFIFSVGILAASIKIYARRMRDNSERKIQFSAAPADLEMVEDGYKNQNREIL